MATTFQREKPNSRLQSLIPLRRCVGEMSSPVLFRNALFFGLLIAAFCESAYSAEFYGIDAPSIDSFTRFLTRPIMSNDGSTIGGSFSTSSEDAGWEEEGFPFLWQPHTGFRELESLSGPGDQKRGYVESLSGNGLVASGEISSYRDYARKDGAASFFVETSSGFEEIGHNWSWGYYTWSTVTADGSRVFIRSSPDFEVNHGGNETGVVGHLQNLYEWTPEKGVQQIQLPEGIAGGSFETNRDGSVFTASGWDEPSYYWTDEEFKTAEELTGMPLRFNNTKGGSGGSVVFETGVVGQINDTIYRWDSNSNELTEINTLSEQRHRRVSNDGDTIAGSDLRGNVFWVWTQEAGVIEPELPPEYYQVQVRSMSGNGAAIGLTAKSVENDSRESLVWTSETGVLETSDYLASFGLEDRLIGWDLSSFRHTVPYLWFSSDGKTIMSTGLSPQGEPDIWIAYLDDVERGDFNRDGAIDVADLDQLTTATRMNPNFEYFDLDDSGVADATDRSIWVKDIMNTCFGDANLDGEFNTNDLVQVFRAGEYEDQIEANSTWGTGDWNGDGEFDTTDLVAAFRDGGYEQGPRAFAAVPEPTSLMLAAFALIAFFTKVRRRFSG